MAAKETIDRAGLIERFGVSSRTLSPFLEAFSIVDHPHVVARVGGGGLPALYNVDAIDAAWAGRGTRTVGRPAMLHLNAADRSAFDRLSKAGTPCESVRAWLASKGIDVSESTVRRAMKSPAASGTTFGTQPLIPPVPAVVKRSRRAKRFEPGQGASSPERGRAVADALLARVRSPECPSLWSGSVRCQITLGLTAAERLVAELANAKAN